MLALSFACIVYYGSSSSGSEEVSVCECQAKRITHPEKLRSWAHCASLRNWRSQEVWSKEIFSVRLISDFFQHWNFRCNQTCCFNKSTNQEDAGIKIAVQTWIKWLSIMWWRSRPPGLIATLTIKTHGHYMELNMGIQNTKYQNTWFSI